MAEWVEKLTKQKSKTVHKGRQSLEKVEKHTVQKSRTAQTVKYMGRERPKKDRSLKPNMPDKIGIKGGEQAS